jgi:hypothetical protein
MGGKKEKKRKEKKEKNLWAGRAGPGPVKRMG